MSLSPNKSEPVDRSQVWLAVWVAVASANDCKRPLVATDWADAALAAFDKRFCAQPEQKESTPR